MVDEDNSFKEIQTYKDRLCIALKAARICVFEVDLTKQLYTFFENAEDIFGVPGDRILQEVQPFSKLDAVRYQKAVSAYFSHPDDEEVISKAFASILSGRSVTYEARMRAGGSRYIWCKIDATPIVENGRPVKLIGVITDISEVKRKTDFLLKEAVLDSFTGLYNKKYATLAIEQILSAPSKQRHALVLLDIDNFKTINDTFGHAEGDRMLKVMSERIKRVFRSSDVISRFGGDEYLILVRNLTERGVLCEKLSELVTFGHPPHIFTISVGVSLFPEDGQSFDELFLKADRALYHSKNQKGCYTFCSDLCK